MDHSNVTSGGSGVGSILGAYGSGGGGGVSGSGGGGVGTGGLMSTGYSALATAYSNAFATSLFDSDLIFQRFLIFVVDFIHIVYDRISDTALAHTPYDLNDELAIFSFSVLVHSLSLGLDTSSHKARFSSLFRNNLQLIRLQFRRMLVFMMHPNHKLATRMQLIKRLMNTPNCETILKCIVTLPDSASSIVSSSVSTNSISVPFTTKLAVHLNSLINSATTTTSNNDKEILSHLGHMLNQCGLGYTKPDSVMAADPSSEFVVTSLSADSHYLMVSQAMQPTSAHVNRMMSGSGSGTGGGGGVGSVIGSIVNRKISVDLSTQIDRDLDDEIMKIFYKAKTAFVRLIEHYERLVNELSEHACTLTNQVVLLHSSARKILFQVNIIKSFYNEKLEMIFS